MSRTKTDDEKVDVLAQRLREHADVARVAVRIASEILKIQHPVTERDICAILHAERRLIHEVLHSLTEAGLVDRVFEPQLRQSARPSVYRYLPRRDPHQAPAF